MTTAGIGAIPTAYIDTTVYHTVKYLVSTLPPSWYMLRTAGYVIVFTLSLSERERGGEEVEVVDE